MNGPNAIKQLMYKYGFKPNKLLGQNFLVDETALGKILAAADLSKNDTVFEIGPGLGILTAALAKHAGYVVAVEKDKKLVEIVKKQFLKVKNVEIIQGDILKEIQNSHPTGDHPKGEKFPGFAKRSGAGKIQNYKRSLKLVRSAKMKTYFHFGLTANYKVVANIPYYLTSHLIRKFLESANPPTQMVLMLQKEVAQRICAQPPHMSILAVSVQFYAEPKIIAVVSKKSFWPQPKVDSAIIRITPYSSPFWQRGVKGDLEQNKILPGPPFTKEGVDKFFKIVKAGFAHPRKQLINNLSRGLKIERAEIVQVLKKIGLKPEQRAETLNVEDWIKLAKLL